MPRKREQADSRTLTKIARLYYEENLTQSEIGESLCLSRPKVSRLLKEATLAGIVQTVVVPPRGTFTDIERQLERRYGLQEAVVVEVTDPNSQEIVSRDLGLVAAGHLPGMLRDGDVIGVAWGASLGAMMAAVQLRPRRGTHVVQLIGGLGAPEADVHVTTVCRRLSNLLGGRLTLIDAPGIVDSRRVKNAILSDSHMKTVAELWSKMRIAYVGIGAPTPESVVLRDGAIMRPEDLRALQRKGAVGDIVLRYFDIEGRGIRSDIDDRVIGISLEQLKQTPIVVGVAGGPNKHKAVRGALSGKLVSVLITDNVLGKQLLDGQ